MEEEYYVTSEAARILKVSEGRIRQMLSAGELEGVHDPVNGRWRIPQRAVHERMERTQPERRAPSTTADMTLWVDRIAELERALGRAEARLELTEHTESTVREALEHERTRYERERERADRLEAELEAERSKGFWRRLFGGSP